MFEIGERKMPSSAVHTFADPDEYAAVFPATSADLTITGRGQFIANVTRIDLHRLWMLRYSDNLPRVKHSANITGRTIIAFRTQHGPGLFFNGKEMHSGNIKQLGPGQSDNQQSAGLASVGVMSLPVEDMASVGKAIAGIELEPPRDGLIVTLQRRRWQSSSGSTRPRRIWRKTLRKSFATTRRRADWSRH